MLKRNRGPHLFVNWANGKNVTNILLNRMEKLVVKSFSDFMSLSKRRPKKKRREMNWISKKVINALLPKYKRKFISG